MSQIGHDAVGDRLRTPMRHTGRGLRRIGLWLRHHGARLVNLVLPPRCAGCGLDIEATGLLCGTCWNDLRILEAPWCVCCGQPFAYDQAGDGLTQGAERCGGCLDAPPVYDHARAAFAYDGVARKLVLGLKHSDKLYFAPLLANWLYRLIQGLPDLAGSAQLVVVPVPLHWRRLLARRHNQSAELARHLVRQANERVSKTIPPMLFEPMLVRRMRATPPQGSDQAPSRHLNVRGAFAIRDNAAINGAHILLIDDVITTGATVNELAKLLKRHGAARVDVLAVTRVLRD